MNTIRYALHMFAVLASIASFAGLAPAALAQASSTGYINPSAPGTYSDWIRSGDPTQVDDGPGCVGGDITDWAATNPPVAPGGRGSAVIVIPPSIPDGATIDSVDIQVCQTRGGAGGNDAEFQTFARVDGVDYDGATLPTADDPFAPEVTNQNIPVGVVKSGATTLEVGVTKIGAPNATLVQTLAAQINYTPAGGPVAPGGSAAIPVFGPFGLLFTALGIGLVGAWRLRRKA